MRARPETRVLEWLNSQAPKSLFTTSVTEAEILAGAWCLPEGRRREEFLLEAADVFNIDFQARVLAFDRRAAAIYGEVVGKRRRCGRPVQSLDAQIAAIALTYGASLATRNVSDFDDLGLRLVNPWD